MSWIFVVIFLFRPSFSGKNYLLEVEEGGEDQEAGSDYAVSRSFSENFLPQGKSSVLCYRLVHSHWSRSIETVL